MLSPLLSDARVALDLLPPALTVLAALAHVVAILRAIRAHYRKERPMSEAPDETIATAGADASAAAPTSPVPPSLDPTPAIVQFAQHPVTQAVVAGVQSNAAVPASNWASVAASVLSSLMPIVQPAEAISRSSTKTQAEIALGLAAIEGVLSVFFPHPAAS